MYKFGILMEISDALRRAIAAEDARGVDRAVNRLNFHTAYDAIEARPNSWYHTKAERDLVRNYPACGMILTGTDERGIGWKAVGGAN